jgi:hypothetical protein
MAPLSVNPPPGISESIQHGIFAYFVPPVTLFALLRIIMWVSTRLKGNQVDELPKEDENQGGKI